MIRVSKLIDELRKFPGDALAYGYEGEITGVVIVSRNAGGKFFDELGYIPASESDTDDDGPAVIDPYP